MQTLNQPTNWLGFGMGGTGKTYLALSAIGPDRALLFDVNHQEKLTRNAVICDDKAQLVELVARGARRICWRGMTTMGATEGFEWGNRCAWAAGNYALYWDEIDLMMRPYFTPEYANKMINAGRHRGCRVFATLRRPSEMPRSLRALATEVTAFQIMDENDAAALRGYFGSEGVQQLPGLKTGEALVWKLGKGHSRKKIW